MTTTSDRTIDAIAAIINRNDDLAADLFDYLTYNDDDRATFLARHTTLTFLINLANPTNLALAFDFCPLHRTDLDACADDDLDCPYR